MMYPGRYRCLEGPPGSLRRNGNIISVRSSGHCVWTPRTAGPRCPNYFLVQRNHTAFNRVKYLLYISYLEATGLFDAQNTENAKTAENKELHGNVYTANSRSRAGSISQTLLPDLVVSCTELGILLPSVFPFLKKSQYWPNLAVSVAFRSLAGRPE